MVDGELANIANTNASSVLGFVYLAYMRKNYGQATPTDGHRYTIDTKNIQKNKSSAHLGKRLVGWSTDSGGGQMC